MAETPMIGWDLGGAHLKAAQIHRPDRVEAVVQHPCPLWRGMEHLDAAIDGALERLGAIGPSAVTMTGELCDLFASREEGVHRLIEAMARKLPATELLVYAGKSGFLAPDEARRQTGRVASANWLASAAFAATAAPSGLLVDIGSTTTDIVPFGAGTVHALGHSDQDRLRSEELVYTGVTRTPVMAIAGAVPFKGERQPLVAELFATMADVHRLTGALAADADQLPAADGGGKSLTDSARRLARMVGSDLEDEEMDGWRRLARHLAGVQRTMLQGAVARVLSRGLLDDEAPIIGAGVGRFLARELAAAMGRAYVDFSTLIEGEADVREWAARCAPAVSVALLAARG